MLGRESAQEETRHEIKRFVYVSENTVPGKLEAAEAPTGGRGAEEARAC